ncbi:hypothetical protein [Altererythrobacter sp.]|uniref:hypothetical protein n=1 Tax=Altererythrobacter sp. TaxID=1872480 RepID=UPI003CFE6C4B
MARLRAMIGILIATSMMVTAYPLVPAHAQLGGLIPRDVQNVVNDAQASDEGCDEGKKKSAGSRVLGGIFGRTARSAAYKSGVSRWVPVSTYSDQLSESIACRLDPEEQAQAADATLRATRSDQYAGEGEDEAVIPAVGSSASWKSETREDVSGTSTVTGREKTRGELDCITVTDVIIVRGEETKADKRMCRPPGSRRYSIVA